MRTLKEAEIDAVVDMVSSVSTELDLPDADFSNDFAQIVRTTKQLPQVVSRGRQNSESAYLDSQAITSIGIGILGFVSVKVMDWACSKALDAGTKTLFDWVQSRRKDSEGKAESVTESIAKESSRDVRVELPMSSKITEEEVSEVVRRLTQRLVEQDAITARLQIQGRRR